MRFREFCKLGIGSKLSLKGTDLVFEIKGFDSSDTERPMMLSLVRGYTPAIWDFVYDEPAMVVPNEYFWVFRDKKTIFENSDLTKSEFAEYNDYAFLTVRNLEVYNELPEFTVGDTVKFKDGNCVLEIVEIDPRCDKLNYKVKILETDKKTIYFPLDNIYDVGDEYWILNNNASKYANHSDYYHITADRLVKVQASRGSQESYEPNTTEEIQESKIHQMFELPTPEELRKLAIQFHLDDISRIIKDAARRGETSVNLPDEMVEKVSEVLISAGYKVDYFKPTNRCIIGW